MIPLKDILPSRSMPLVVIALISTSAAVWVLELLQGSEMNEFVLQWGLVPLRILDDEDPQKWITPVSSMFMHGSWMHIIGNMWFLWIFGDNVEDAFGHMGFLLFYFACGLAAAAFQMLVSPGSQMPMVGASGAISGVLGAYACFFPRARIVTLIPIFIFIQFAEIPAIIFIVFWFIFQLASGCATLGLGVTGGVAFWAHIGGFLAGVFIALLWKRRLTGRQGGRGLHSIHDGIFTFRKHSRYRERGE